MGMPAIPPQSQRTWWRADSFAVKDEMKTGGAVSGAEGKAKDIVEGPRMGKPVRLTPTLPPAPPPELAPAVVEPVIKGPLACTFFFQKAHQNQSALSPASITIVSPSSNMARYNTVQLAGE